MEYSKLILNPARLRIMQYANLHGQITTTQLMEALGDIPRATIYHHVKLLEEHQLLTVVEEHKVRGTTEKVLSPVSILSMEKNVNFMALAAAFSADLLQELEIYYASAEADMKRDQVFFQKGILAVTDSEYNALLAELTAAMSKYIGLPKTQDRRFRTLALVSTLPIEEGGREA